MHCKTCSFFNAEQPQCRRYAPQPDDTAGEAKWPTVSATDWCGEYEADADKIARVA